MGRPDRTESEARADGMVVRREVLSDAHVDSAEAGKTGFTVSEIQEVLLQSAVYCGVPAAHHAFTIAQEALASFDEETDR